MSLNKNNKATAKQRLRKTKISMRFCALQYNNLFNGLKCNTQN